METIVAFIKNAAEKVAYPASNFLGAKVAGPGSLELNFEKVDGSAADEVVTLAVTDADGVGFKRAAQALANALGGYHHAGKYVKIADLMTGEYIHRDITSVETP